MSGPADPLTDAALAARARVAVLPHTGAANRLVLVIAAMMAFLAVLTIATSLGAAALGTAWRTDLAGAATVRITGTRAEIEDRVRFVLDVLETTPGIASARPLSDAEQAALLAPWLGAGAHVEALPLPRLIDVTLDGDGPDAGALQARLDLTVAGAVYDDHAAWRGPLAASAAGLMRLAIAATGIILAGAVMMVAFAAAATLSANQDTVRTVRLIGAEDRFIAAAFVNRMTLHASLGALGGAGLATAALALMPALGDPSILPGAMPQAAARALAGPARAAALVLGVPAILALTAWVTARVTVLLALRRMP